MYLASDWTEYILWLNYCTNPWNLVKNTWCPDPELLIKKELAADLKINSYKNFAIFLINNDNNGGWDRYTRYFSPFNKCSSICQCTSGKSKTPLLLFFINAACNLEIKWLFFGVFFSWMKGENEYASHFFKSKV